MDLDLLAAAQPQDTRPRSPAPLSLPTTTDSFIGLLVDAVRVLVDASSGGSVGGVPSTTNWPLIEPQSAAAIAGDADSKRSDQRTQSAMLRC